MKYENGASSRRNSNWQLIGYPESLGMFWEDKISQDVQDWYISPLHDKDVYTKDEQHKNSDGVIVTNKAGTLKKPHYHVLVKFDSLKSWEQVKEWACDSLGFAMIQSVMSWTGSLRYLCHLDGGTGKELYNVNDVRCLNDDYLTQINRVTDKAMITRMIVAYIQEKKIKDFHVLVKKALEEGSDWLSEIRSGAFFYKTICQSIKAVSVLPYKGDVVKSASRKDYDIGYKDDTPF